MATYNKNMGSKRKSEDSISRGTPDNTGKRVKVMAACTNFGVVTHHANYPSQ